MRAADSEQLTADSSKARAVAVARSWIGTPRVLGGRLKGVGCDCGTLLVEYLIEIGSATRGECVDLGFYTDDWFCHETSERYLLRIMRHARQVAEAVCRPGVGAAEPGCLVLFRTPMSRRWNHGAIVTHWPYGVHAYARGVEECDLSSHPLVAFRPMDVLVPCSLSTEQRTANSGQGTAA